MRGSARSNFRVGGHRRDILAERSAGVTALSTRHTGYRRGAAKVDAPCQADHFRDRRACVVNYSLQVPSLGRCLITRADARTDRADQACGESAATEFRVGAHGADLGPAGRTQAFPGHRHQSAVGPQAQVVTHLDGSWRVGAGFGAGVVAPDPSHPAGEPAVFAAQRRPHRGRPAGAARYRRRWSTPWSPRTLPQQRPARERQRDERPTSTGCAQRDSGTVACRGAEATARGHRPS